MKLCMNRWVEDNDMEADDALKTWRKRWLYNLDLFLCITLEVAPMKRGPFA